MFGCKWPICGLVHYGLCLKGFPRALSSRFRRALNESHPAFKGIFCAQWKPANLATLILIHADWCLLMLIYAAWCRLILIDADWCWLILIDSDQNWKLNQMSWNVFKFVPSLWVSGAEAAKEDASKWREWWILIIAKITLKMVARLTNAISVNISLLLRAIWGDIGKHTVEKSRTNATNVVLHPLKQALWEHIWKHRVEKSQTNATNVVLHPLIQALWEHIWKPTAEKS